MAGRAPATLRAGVPVSMVAGDLDPALHPIGRQVACVQVAASAASFLSAGASRR